ncbi:MAG: class I SAM-dependent methyltransferase [bacterium]|nr:class I SAM-dependent methyltransferase [bacterium]
MKRNQEKIRTMYDAIACDWVKAFPDEHEKKPKDREVLERFALEIGDRQPVWDFGCGPGNTSKYLTDLGVEISGLDLSDNMVKQARAAYPEICFRRGDLLDLDFAANTIAGIVALYAIVHFTSEQVELALQEMHRVLQPGGTLLLTFHIGDETIHIDEFLGKTVDVDFMFFSTGLIVDCLKTAGFGKIEVIEREPYPDIEYQSRRAYMFAEKPEA